MVKVQERKIKGGYIQYWVGLPKKICDFLGLTRGTELTFYEKNGEIRIRKKE